MSLVDIIVPAYNAARHLPSAIESVLSQTFEDWRILLVDDGSTDNTEEVVAPFLKRLGAKIAYIRQENRGLPGARNTAIRNSSAEFLALLDADDIWLPCRLAESLLSFEQRPQTGLCYGLIDRIDQHGNFIGSWRGNPQYAEGNIAPQIYMLNVQLPCPTVIFRRRCIDEVGFFDETLRATEDRDLWFRIAQRYEVAVVPKVIASYRTSPDSMSADPNRMLKAQLQFIRKHYGSAGCGPVQRRVAFGHAYKQHADALKLRNQPCAGLRSALRAVALSPLDTGNVRTAASLLLGCLRIGSR